MLMEDLIVKGTKVTVKNDEKGEVETKKIMLQNSMFSVIITSDTVDVENLGAVGNRLTLEITNPQKKLM